MSPSLAKIWARKIHDGTKTLDDVYYRFGDEGVLAVQQAYYDLYGEDLT